MAQNCAMHECESMCGIVAYHGCTSALPALLDGLARLEYRGYDSVGVALLSAAGSDLTVHKVAGRIPDLIAVLPADAGTRHPIGIGHTRWATHGAAVAAPTRIATAPDRSRWCTTAPSRTPRRSGRS